MKRFVYLIITLLLPAQALLAQGKAVLAKIKEVENNLLPGIQFADSTIMHYNISDRMKSYIVPSVSIAVINHGKIAWAKAYGLADVKLKRKATTNTLYQAASISKSVNAVSIMRLVKENKVDLDTSISSYLKTWQLPVNDYNRGRKITLRKLLSHTAGISVAGFNSYKRDSPQPTLDQILNGHPPANSEPIKPITYPDSGFRYSGGGTVISRKIMEDITGKGYIEILNNTVLQPLKMTRSTYDQPLPSTWADVASGYHQDGREVEGKYLLNPELAPDGLWTTPTDLAKLIITLQESLSGKSNFLDSIAVKELFRKVTGDVAPGFFIYTKGKDTYFQHAGSNFGYKSNYFGSLHKGNGVVVMINSDQYDIVPEIINSVAKAYGWTGFYNPVMKKLVVVPDQQLTQYVGRYSLESPEMHFKIKKMNGHLFLTSGVDDYERMYFTSEHDFLLLSSKQLEWTFKKEKGSQNYELLIKQGKETFRTKREQ